MKLSQITIGFFALIGKICSTGIVIRIPGIEEWSELMVEAMVNILASCYPHADHGMGLYGDFSETFIPTLNSRKPIPMFLIDETDCGDRPTFHRRKLNLFVIIASDHRQVSNGFDQIHCSRWFSGRASFLIVDWKSTAKYESWRAANMFYSAWLKKLLNVNVLFLHPTKGRMLSGYNPHTDQAPSPWRLVETLQWNELPTLSIFEREYQPKSICRNIDFDKTNNLGGSRIELMRVSFGQSRMQQSMNQHLSTLVFGEELSNVIDTFVRQVNGTESIKVSKNVTDSVKDLTEFRINYENARTIETTYPCMQMEIMMMTNFLGYKSQLAKIIGVVDSYSQLGTCVVLMLTLIFFKFFARQTSIHAILNTGRILCNASFTNLPRNVASRIYVACVLLFMVTMQGIFTGHLAYLLTRDIPVHQPKTLEELTLDRNYTIYARRTFANLFSDPIYNKSVVLLDPVSLDCLEYLLRDRWGACVEHSHWLMDGAASYSVKMTGRVVSHLYWALRTENDWYLVDRFNKIFVTMTESHIVDSFNASVLRKRLSYVHPDDPSPEVMTLKDLRFNFVILGIGLGCATVTFIIEISMKTIRSAFGKVRERFWNFVG